MSMSMLRMTVLSHWKRILGAEHMLLEMEGQGKSVEAGVGNMGTGTTHAWPVVVLKA